MIKFYLVLCARFKLLEVAGCKHGETVTQRALPPAIGKLGDQLSPLPAGRAADELQKVGETSPSPLTHLLGVLLLHMVLNNRAGAAGLGTKDTCPVRRLPAPPRVFLVSPREMVKMSAGLFSLFVVCIFQNLRAAWILMSGIAVLLE